MPGKGVDWKKELDDLLVSSKSPEDAAATKAFADAIGPYLDNPELLRTLLGKIQRRLGVDEVRVLGPKLETNSIKELNKSLPKDIEIIDIE